MVDAYKVAKILGEMHTSAAAGLLSEMDISIAAGVLEEMNTLATSAAPRCRVPAQYVPRACTIRLAVHTRCARHVHPCARSRTEALTAACARQQASDPASLLAQTVLTRASAHTPGSYALYKTPLGKTMHDRTCADCAGQPPHSSPVITPCFPAVLCP